MKICGFMVVDSARGGYRGIDREPWKWLHQQYYAGNLKEDLSIIRKQIYQNGLDFSAIELTREIDVAKHVLRCVKEGGGEGEIIALFSPSLEERKGCFDFPVQKKLGFDIFSFGDWSLIKAGVVDSTIMSHWREKLNASILLNDESESSVFVHEYLKYVQSGQLEEISLGNDFPVEPVLIAEIR